MIIRPRSLLLLTLALPACGDGGGSTDAGPRSDAFSPGSDDAGPPLSLAELPADTWSFVPVPGAVCGNGSPFSIGVNPHPGATELLVVIMGGGACWDANTCFTLDSAAHISEDYTRATFEMERGLISAVGWDDRAAPLNPFRAANIVFVPYCTGDLHAGDAVQSYPGAPGGQRVHHRGAVNTQLYIDGMQRAWPTLATTRVIGFSAGGYGTQLNWGRFADAWPDADLSLLADCAPLAEPDPALYAAWRSSWSLYTPADCAACTTSFAAYDDYFDARHPESRLGLLATTRDSVLTAFWGVADFTPRLDALLTDHLDDNATTRYFAVDSDQHVILGEAATLRSSDGTLLFDWVLGWLANDARWHNTRP